MLRTIALTAAALVAAAPALAEAPRPLQLAQAPPQGADQANPKKDDENKGRGRRGQQQQRSGPPPQQQNAQPQQKGPPLQKAQPQQRAQPQPNNEPQRRGPPQRRAQPQGAPENAQPQQKAFQPPPRNLPSKAPQPAINNAAPAPKGPPPKSEVLKSGPPQGAESGQGRPPRGSGWNRQAAPPNAPAATGNAQPDTKSGASPANTPPPKTFGSQDRGRGGVPFARDQKGQKGPDSAPSAGAPPSTNLVAPTNRFGSGEPRRGRDGRADGRGGPASVAAPANLEAVKKESRVRVEDGGRRRVTEQPGNRTIIRQDNKIIIRHNESDRFRRFGNNVRTVRRNGNNVTIVNRPGGIQVMSYYDTRGNLLEVRRRGPGGREVRLIDNRRVFGRTAKIAAGAALIGLTVALAAPRIAIARNKYIVDYEEASPDDLYEALSAPPVERLPRRYALEEIRYSHDLRERLRRVDLDAITFEFGAWEVSPDQRGKLERVARVLLRILERDPEKIFMIEGHTDLVGTDEDNLTLSSHRAESVAIILTEEFGVPPENLVTQGYGEQYPKIDTDGPERRNRRVALRNISDLLARGER